MATCKDCVHYDVCEFHLDEKTTMTVNECMRFKDKSRFVELPCKIGDTLYYICGNRVESDEVHSIYVDCWNSIAIKLKWVRGRVNSSEIGKTVFLTREEAEKALKECEPSYEMYEQTGKKQQSQV